MMEFIAGGWLGTLPSFAALGVAASLTLAGCSIAGQEPDQADRPPANSGDARGESGATGSGAAADSPQATTDAGPTESATEAPPEDAPDEAAPESDDGPPEDGDGLEEPPPFYANTLPDHGDAVGGGAGFLTDLRMGVHPGFDRVVFELEGPGVPQWHVRYVDFVIGDPSGAPLEIEGPGVLEVTLVGVSYPQDDAAAYDGPSRVRVNGSQAVTEVLFNSVFEGQLQAFIGVDPRELPFRAYRLTNPSRVVVEVQHPR